jgi:hypothetical protein
MDREKRFFLVRHGADLSEGKGFRETSAVVVETDLMSHQLFVEDFCYKKFGKPVGFVMGRYSSSTITRMWKIAQTSEEYIIKNNIPILETIVVKG